MRRKAAHAALVERFNVEMLRSAAPGGAAPPPDGGPMRLECAPQNIKIGLLAIGVSLLFIYVFNPVGIEVPPHSRDAATAMPPDFFPNLICWSAAFFGLCLIASSIYTLKKEGRPKGPPPQANPDMRAVATRVAAMIVLLAYYWVAQWLGIVLAGFAFYLLFAFFTGERSMRTAVTGAALTVAVLYYFFVKVALVPLPLGLLGDIL